MDKLNVPEFMPALPRTRSDDLTSPMRSLDHRIVRQDGPPDFEDEEDTHVDGVIDTVVYDTRIPWTPIP
jgi:hypothetical protein